ncbi:hypothetical protein DNTS_007028, partial [Danionella cerebrum]
MVQNSKVSVLRLISVQMRISLEIRREKLPIAAEPLKLLPLPACVSPNDGPLTFLLSGFTSLWDSRDGLHRQAFEKTLSVLLDVEAKFEDLVAECWRNGVSIAVNCRGKFGLTRVLGLLGISLDIYSAKLRFKKRRFITAGVWGVGDLREGGTDKTSDLKAAASWLEFENELKLNVEAAKTREGWDKQKAAMSRYMTDQDGSLTRQALRSSVMYTTIKDTSRPPKIKLPKRMLVKPDNGASFHFTDALAALSSPALSVQCGIHLELWPFREESMSPEKAFYQDDEYGFQSGKNGAYQGQPDTSGHMGTRDIIQSPLVSWTHATVQRGFLLGFCSCFNDVVLEQGMKTLRHALRVQVVVKITHALGVFELLACSFIYHSDITEHSRTSPTFATILVWPIVPPVFPYPSPGLCLPLYRRGSVQILPDARVGTTWEPYVKQSNWFHIELGVRDMSKLPSVKFLMYSEDLKGKEEAGCGRQRHSPSSYIQQLCNICSLALTDERGSELTPYLSHTSSSSFQQHHLFVGLPVTLERRLNISHRRISGLQFLSRPWEAVSVYMKVRKYLAEVSLGGEFFGEVESSGSVKLNTIAKFWTSQMNSTGRSAVSGQIITLNLACSISGDITPLTSSPPLKKVCKEIQDSSSETDAQEDEDLTFKNEKAVVIGLVWKSDVGVHYQQIESVKGSIQPEILLFKNGFTVLRGQTDVIGSFGILKSSM